MLSFESDYNNGAHPEVLKRIVETNDTRSRTYGFDEWSNRAKEKIKTACEAPEAQIWFLVGGTQTNATVIDAMLDHRDGVVAVDSAHINVHEAGAIEYTGHKVITLPEHDGKMLPEELDDMMVAFENDPTADHCVRPGMVYITLPTEYGTLYTAAELDNIYKVCQKHGLPLYIDGARLGYGLTAEGNDITLPYLAHHCDAFYIGGTKVGALCGEAVVFTHNNAHPRFFSIVKQHGALLAKGRLVGQQFDVLFTDDLYFNISRHAVQMAMRLKAAFKAKGYELYVDSPTNQQFVILPNDEVARLSQHIVFEPWRPCGEGHTLCRFVTSWATTEEEVEELERIVRG